MSTIAMALLTIGLCGCSKARGLTRSQYEQIKLGMSIEQVQAIIGPESGWKPPGGWNLQKGEIAKHWGDDTSSISVWFRDGKASRKTSRFSVETGAAG
jgi:hypothetical protein